MNKLFLAFGMLLTSALCAQAQTYMTRTCKVHIDATTKSSPEKVEAKNNEAACIVDAKTGEVRFQVPIKSFKFERESMQEHFNENYMESDKFPKSEFKGTITNLGSVNFGADGTYNTTVSGKLTMHGVTRDVTENGTITISGNTARLKASFVAKLKDYDISVPAVVADKVDKNVTISLDGELTKK